MSTEYMGNVPAARAGKHTPALAGTSVRRLTVLALRGAVFRDLPCVCALDEPCVVTLLVADGEQPDLGAVAASCRASVAALRWVLENMLTGKARARERVRQPSQSVRGKT